MEFFTFIQKRNFFPFRQLMNIKARKAHFSNQSAGFVDEFKNEKGKSIINVHRSIDVPDSKVYPTHSINDLIKEYGSKSIIGQFTCMWRRMKSNMDTPCRVDMPDDCGCMGFGDSIKPLSSMARHDRSARNRRLRSFRKPAAAAPFTLFFMNWMTPAGHRSESATAAGTAAGNVSTSAPVRLLRSLETAAP
jgi:hypothetical protein